MPIIATKSPSKVPPPEERKVVGKFTLLRGRHTEGKNEDGHDVIYLPGETFESKSDLRLHDPKGLKFKPVGEINEANHVFNVGGFEPAYDARDRNNKVLEARGQKQSLKETQESQDHDFGGDDLQHMTKADLIGLAEEEEIDLAGAHNKADIVAAIRHARGGRGDVP